ncbi:Leucine-rich repeats and immunoglobulin-like domains protein 3, partial [Trichoplax sp. H2]
VKSLFIFLTCFRILNRNNFELIDPEICNGPQNLLYLDLKENKIQIASGEALSNCSHSLQAVNFEVNAISTLDTVSLSSLRKLRSLIVGTDISNCKALKSTSSNRTLNSNPISTILYNESSVPLPYFRKLDLHTNFLANLTEEPLNIFNQSTDIKFSLSHPVHDVTNTSVTTLMFPNLQVLDFSENFIHPDYNYSYHQSLTHLSITNSKIADKPYIIKQTNFRGLHKLKTLYIRRNRVQGISNESFPFLPALQTLDLIFNAISTIQEDAFRSISGLQNL